MNVKAIKEFIDSYNKTNNQNSNEQTFEQYQARNRGKTIWHCSKKKCNIQDQIDVRKINGNAVHTIGRFHRQQKVFNKVWHGVLLEILRKLDLHGKI